MSDLHPLPEQFGVEILRTEVGSTLHGTGLAGSDDLDQMGIYVEHPGSTIGFGHRPHYVWRSAQDGERSQSHDTDLVVYSLRKWCGLALSGNPSVLLVLFAPAGKVVLNTPLGHALRFNAEWFASRRAGKAFLGYMEQQRQRMVGQRGRAGRVRIMPDGGVDWKYAMHMLRLGYQGEEYLRTGGLTLPIPGDVGDHFRAVRRGDIPFENVIVEAEEREAVVKALLDGESPLPPEPNTDAAEKWCIQAHLGVWASSPLKEGDAT